jgi:hypothetical protein
VTSPNVSASCSVITDKSVSAPTGGDFTHVQCVIDCLPDCLTETERHMAIDFITKNVDRFSKSEYDLGKTELLQHTIDYWRQQAVPSTIKTPPTGTLASHLMSV